MQQKTHSIKIRTMLTTDILVTYTDGSLSLNPMIEMAQLIGEAVWIDQEEKDVRVLRFESNQFPLASFTKDMWLKFDEQCSLKTTIGFDALKGDFKSINEMRSISTPKVKIDLA